MLSAREVGIVAQRELSRNLRSTKGVAMFVLFFMGGLVSVMLRVLLRQLFAANLPESRVREAFHQALMLEYKGNEEIAGYLSNAPPLVYVLFKGTLTFLPLLVLLVGFDQIVGEVQHRTIRYSAGRAFRPSIVAGKALGIWGVAAVMISVLHVTVWMVALLQGGQSAGSVLSWGGRMLFFSVICAGAYVGFASIVSAVFRTPIVALFAGVGAGFGLGITYYLFSLFASDGFRAFVDAFSSNDASVMNRPPGPPTAWQKLFEALTWAFPNRYEDLFFRPDAGHVATGLSLCIVWGVACVAVASTIVQRRDV